MKTPYKITTVLFLLAAIGLSAIALLRYERTSREMLVGEMNASSIVIVKALTLLHEGDTERASQTLEDWLDLNIVDIWNRGRQFQSSTNTLVRIRRYRRDYPKHSEYVNANRDGAYLERFQRAEEILSSMPEPIRSRIPFQPGLSDPWPE